MPSIMSNADGRLEIFILCQDRAIWHQWQDGEGSWSDWDSLGGSFSRFCVEANRDGRLEVFGVNVEGSSVAHRYQEGNGWADWADIGASTAELVCAKNNDGRLELFATDRGDDRPIHAWQRSSAGWTGWQHLGSGDIPRLTELAIAPNGNGLLEVFGISKVNGSAMHCYQTGNGWSNWQTHGESLKSLVCEVNNDGRIELFAITNQGRAVHKWQDNPGWSDWRQLSNGEINFKSISAYKEQNGRLVAHAKSDASVYRSRQGADGEWSAWSEERVPSVLNNIPTEAAGLLLLGPTRDNFDYNVTEAEQRYKEARLNCIAAGAKFIVYARLGLTHLARAALADAIVECKDMLEKQAGLSEAQASAAEEEARRAGGNAGDERGEIEVNDDKWVYGVDFSSSSSDSGNIA